MRRMKKGIALVMATLMSMSVMLSGCAKEAENTAGESSASAVSSEAGKEASEQVTLDVMVWCRDIDNLDFDTMEFYKEIEEKTGIHVEFTKVMESDWETKTNLMFSSNEYPDIILKGGVDTEMYGVDQGILLPLDEYIDEYMPNYAEKLAVDESLASSLRSSDGKMYKMGWIIPQNINVDGHLFVNEKWLEAVGKEVPATAQEFEDMLRAFKNDDPNGNGEADEIPFTATYDGNNDGVLNLMYFWGIPRNNYYVCIAEDGKTVNSWFYQDGLRDALETMHKWYDEGLIDIEAVSQDTNAFEAKVNSGLSGSFFRWRMLAMGTDDAIAEEYDCILPVSADGYEANIRGYMELPGFGAAITTSCENIEAACKWLDAQLEFETMLTAYNGYNMWEKDETTGMYNILGVDNSLNTPGQSSVFYVSGEEYFSKVNMPVHRIEKTDYCKEYTAAEVIESNPFQILTSLCIMTVDENEEKALLFAEIDKYADEALVDFITKGVTDDKWDKFMSTLDKLKIDRYVELYQTTYNRYLEANK